MFRMPLAVCVLALACAPLATRASAPEACALVATVKRIADVVVAGESAVYSFDLVVAAAQASGPGFDEAPCRALVGRTLAVDLTLPVQAGVPTAGDRITLTRESDAIVGGGGYIVYAFTGLHAATPPAAAEAGRCMYGAVIGRVAATAARRRFTFDVVVDSAVPPSPAADGGSGGCDAAVGTGRVLTLDVPADAGLPRAGDRIEFTGAGGRDVVDGADSDIRFVALHPAGE